MSDPFLSGHRHSPNLYSLAGRTPLSIHDQIIRAHHLVERLLSTQALKPGSTLLVVGAGAAGASVVTTAARRGVNVTVVSIVSSQQSFTRSTGPAALKIPQAHGGAKKIPPKREKVSPSQRKRVWKN